jgi:ABC-type transport system involved in cytochrome c biogenesis permease subunit
MKKFIPFLALVIAILVIAVALTPVKNKTAFDLVGFGELPVLSNGRIKPLDTVARSSLLQLQGKQAVKLADGTRLTPEAWLLDVFFRPDKADTYPIFAVHNPELLSLVHKGSENESSQYLAFKDFIPYLQSIEDQAKLASPIEEKSRTAFQRSVTQVAENLMLYERLEHTIETPGTTDFLGELLQFQKDIPAGVQAVRLKQEGKPHDEVLAQKVIQEGKSFMDLSQATSIMVIPSSDPVAHPSAWSTMGQSLLQSFEQGGVDSSALAYAGLGYAWQKQNADQFNQLIPLYRDELNAGYSQAVKKTKVETRFNAAEPFYISMCLYVAAFIIAVISWLKWPESLGRAAFIFVLAAWLLSTAGICTRMWLEGRPPVTNLYSSALFVGWGAVGLCLILEAVFKNAIGSVAAGLVGFSTLLIAHHLALTGDTLEMMRAVLDSNFWLATHVVIVTTGYASTFLAGFLAIIYIVRGLFTQSLDKVTAESLTRMVYGIVCFATLFSLVGTILGGVWADQSWGRFWGWDPKENGALIIVLWNALILHARWGGLVKQRGIMCFAIFGNIVTAWSWFGTNMLGIGLHSYGFTEAAFWSLALFVISQLVLIGLGNLPLKYWRSFKASA